MATAVMTQIVQAPQRMQPGSTILNRGRPLHPRQMVKSWSNYVTWISAKTGTLRAAAVVRMQGPAVGEDMVQYNIRSIVL